MTSWLDDPEAVAEEYASEAALRERLLAFRELAEGPDDEEILRERILATRPRLLLDVGSGLGGLCVWAKAQLDAEVVAVDSSPRMVELAAQAGITAVLADIRELPFADASFDCAVASSVLHHVPDPGTAISELARVLNGRMGVAARRGDTRGSAALLQPRERTRPPPSPFPRRRADRLRRRPRLPDARTARPLRGGAPTRQGGRRASTRARGTVSSPVKGDRLPGKHAKIDTSDGVVQESPPDGRPRRSSRSCRGRSLPSHSATVPVHGEVWKAWATTDPLPATAYFAITEEPTHVANDNRIAFWVESSAEVDRLAEVARRAGATELSGRSRCPTGRATTPCSSPIPRGTGSRSTSGPT